MAATKVVLMGSLGIAAECLRWLRQQPDVEIVGVVCSRKPLSAWRSKVGDDNVQDVAREFGAPLVALEEVVGLGADIGLSVRFHRILRRRHLDAFRLGVVNLHGAPLPEMRGSMCDAAAILEGHTTFGTSLHWMDEGIDSGDLLAVSRFDIAPDDTTYDLFARANRLGLELIQQHFQAIVRGELTGQNQDELIRATGIVPKTYRAKEMSALKELSLPVSAQEIWDRARAFAFPGHDPAFVQTPHGRVDLNITSPRSASNSLSRVTTPKVSNRSKVVV